MRPSRILAGNLALAVLLVGCSDGRTTTSPTTISTGGSPSDSTDSTLSPATTVAAYPTVSATGSLLQPPASPSTIPAQQDCHRLLTQPAATASITACATASAASGTVTGTDERYAHTQQWDVWKRNGNSADLVLTYTENFQSTPGFVFHSADLANDAQPKLLAVEHTPGTEHVSAVDIIETSGAVIAHVDVGAKGGVVGPAPGGGIETWTLAGTTTATIIRYTNGAWRTTSASPVPANQVPTYPDDDGFGGGLP